MSEINGIQLPCFGSLIEIHAALVDDLNWIGNQVSIDGWGYTVVGDGFQRNNSGTIYPPDNEGFVGVMHPGTAILCGFEKLGGDSPEDCLFTIITTGKIPHISKRCALCGAHLDQEGIARGACGSCYAKEVGY